MLSIRLTADIEHRLTLLAAKMGCTKTALAREAIRKYIDDLEDGCLAEARAHKNRKSIPLLDVEKVLGLAN